MTREENPIGHWPVAVSISRFILEPDELIFVGGPQSEDFISIVLPRSAPNLQALTNICWLDYVEIRFGEGDPSQTLVYGGLCTNVDSNEMGVRLSIESWAYELRHTITKYVSFQSASPWNMFHFLARESGMEDSRIQIADPRFGKTPHTHAVLFPVENLDISRQFAIGSVRFIPKAEPSGETTLFGELPEDWPKRCSAAKVLVVSKNLYEAYVTSRELVENALAVLALMFRSASGFRRHGLSHEVGPWRREHTLGTPRITSWVCILDVVSHERLVADMDREVNPSTLQICEADGPLLRDYTDYENMLFPGAGPASKEQTRTLLSSLRWLRRSWEAPDPEDSVMYAITALEFVLAGESAPPLVPSDLYDQLVTACTKVIRERMQNSGDIEAYIARRIPQALGEAPLFARLDSLISRLRIPITDEEVSLLKKARNARNGLVHGGHSTILTHAESQKVCNTVGKLVSHKLAEIGGSV